MWSDKVSNLREWNLAEVPGETVAALKVHFVYPAVQDVIHVEPEKRIAWINVLMRGYLEVLAL